MIIKCRKTGEKKYFIIIFNSPINFRHCSQEFCIIGGSCCVRRLCPKSEYTYALWAQSKSQPVRQRRCRNEGEVSDECARGSEGIHDDFRFRANLLPLCVSEWGSVQKLRALAVVAGWGLCRLVPGETWPRQLISQHAWPNKLAAVWQFVHINKTFGVADTTTNSPLPPTSHPLALSSHAPRRAQTIFNKDYHSNSI